MQEKDKGRDAAAAIAELIVNMDDGAVAAVERALAMDDRPRDIGARARAGDSPKLSRPTRAIRYSEDS